MRNNETGGDGKYCVQLYSRRARLVTEFYLDAKEHNLADMDAAEEHLRQTLTPCDFASTVTLMSDNGSNDETILQFELKQA